MTPTATGSQKPTISPLVARAKAIIAGELVPEPMELPPEHEAAWQAEVASWTVRVPQEVGAHLRSLTALDVLYAGQHVLTFTLARGDETVLACGPEEVVEVRKGLTPEENRQAAGGVFGVRPW